MKNETYFYCMIFPNGTIRVVSPVTEDGNRPKLDSRGQQIWKEDFFPLSAKRAFELQNNKLPNHLKKKIEVLNDVDITLKENVANQATISEPTVIRRKPGPKPKVHA